VVRQVWQRHLSVKRKLHDPLPRWTALVHITHWLCFTQYPAAHTNSAPTCRIVG